MSVPHIINVKGTIIPTDYKWIYDWLDMESTCPRDITKALEKANGEDVEVHINSGGGSVFAGVEMHTSLISYPGNVKVKIVGLAGSAASIVASVGSAGSGTVEIAPAGMIMIHNCSSSADGDYRDMYTAGDQLKKINNAIANAYIGRTGMSREELLSLMDDETWMDADDAIKYGFADKIMESQNVPSQMGMTGSSRPLMFTNSCYEIPEKTITKIQGLLAGNSLDLLNNKGDVTMGENNNPTVTPVTQIGNMESRVTNQIPQNGEGMSLEQFLAANPSAKAEYETRITNAHEEGAEVERTRLQDIDSISQAVPADMLMKAKYEEPVDAKTLSFQVMQAGKGLASNYMTRAISDSVGSGAADVTPAVSQHSEEDKEAASADRIANSANKGRKPIKFI